MPKDQDSKRGNGSARQDVDDLQKYLLRSNRQVVNLLRALATKPDLITARIPSTDHTVVTAVLDVLKKKNLVVFDYGPDEALNKKLLEVERIVFTARHNMVETRFSCEGVKRVKYKSELAFASPIPESILYLERRSYFRIKPLVSHPVFCELFPENAQSLKLKSIDLSINGLSLEVSHNKLDLHEGERFAQCKLTLPANPTLEVKLEIRYITSCLSKESTGICRIGASFIDLTKKDESTLQRFINMVQMEQNALTRG